MKIRKRDVMCECGHARADHVVSLKYGFSACFAYHDDCRDRRKKIACKRWRPSNLITLEAAEYWRSLELEDQACKGK